ncbi:hypothetical protein PENTCL1PPCAC_17787, partial [Pristionchus entomophagus]
LPSLSPYSDLLHFHPICTLVHIQDCVFSVFHLMDPPHLLLPSTKMHSNSWPWKTFSPSEEVFRSVRILSSQHLVLNPTISIGSVAWRGDKPLSESTRAYWEVEVDGSPYGTSVQFGIGRRHSLCRILDFVDLLGMDDNSYGLNHLGFAQRAGMKVRVSKPLEGINPRIGLLFDGPNRSLSFFINDEYLCTPFVDIDLSETLYPFVSSTSQWTSLRLCNQYSKNEVLSLLSLTRRKVNDSFDSKFLNAILPKDILL